RRILPKLIQWHEHNNVYGLQPFLGQNGFAFLFPISVVLIKDLDEWTEFWGIDDTGSLEGPVLLRGNPLKQLVESPETITPDDFRLRPDSAGYQAGKDGKDFGANVDLVGPGPAYERWKKTPEYQQWLKETGQFRAELPKVEPNAFVLL